MVGTLLEPMPVNAMGMILGEQSLSGSPTGPRGAIDTMLSFAARHNIRPQIEHFAMNRVNDAMEHLKAGKARYRIVLGADFE
jgi:alcohol/geraniol dehydrogenase (NADP+)